MNSFPRLALATAIAAALSGCALPRAAPPERVVPSNVNSDATLTPVNRYTLDLTRLPPPRYRVPVAVYSFRDQTGQFKPQPDSNLSNMVTQGAGSILVKSLLDSGWYLPVEREGFQNLLNERRVARALEVPADKGKPGASYPSLIPASYIIEGGIIGYETNVRTGGSGANLLGVGAETKYRVDQVTVMLRSVDVRTGQIANSVSVTKTVFSHELSSSIYRFVSYKTLLQAEGGYSTNEPSQLAVKEAIEAAVIHLTLQGISNRVWSLRDDRDWDQPLVQSYMRESLLQLSDPRSEPATAQVPMGAPVLARPPSLPIHMQQVQPPADMPGPGPAAAAPAPQAPAQAAAEKARQEQAAQKAATERLAAQKAEAERAAAEKAAAAKAAADKLAAERAEAERLAAERAAAEQAAAAKAAADKLAAERAEAERLAAERAAADKLAAERAEAERAEAERLAAERAAAEKAAAAKAAADKLAAERAEAERLAAERAAAEKAAAAKAAADKLAAERAEAERLAAERAEAERRRTQVPVLAPPAPALQPPEPQVVPDDKPALDIIFTV